MVFAGFERAAGAQRVCDARKRALRCPEDDVQHRCSFWMRCAVVRAHFWRRIAAFSFGNRAVLHPISGDFGVQQVRIDRKTCAIIAGSLE